jgi:hypothetical protein
VAAACVGAHAAGDARLHVSPSGSDEGRCTQSAPCASFDRAYRVAKPGQVVVVASGKYPSQTILPDDTKTSPNDVVFQPALGAVVDLSYGSPGGGIAILGASHLTIKGMRAGILWIQPSERWCCRIQKTTRFTEDVSLVDLRLNTVGIYSAANVTVRDSVLGDFAVSDTAPNNIGTAAKVGSWTSSSSLPALRSHDITFDNNLFHNLVRPSGVQTHAACFYQTSAVTNLVVTRNKFTHCAVIDWENAPEPWVTPSDTYDGLVIENNWFDVPTATDDRCCGSQTIGLMTGSGASPKFLGKNWSIRYNSIKGFITVGNAAYENVTIASNVWQNIGLCAAKPGLVYRRNVIGGRNAAKCGPTDILAPTGWIGDSGVDSNAAFDFRLKRGAAAIDLGDPQAFPTDDIHGQARPLGKRPDAGADEFSR